MPPYAALFTLLLTALCCLASSERILHVTRDYFGDIFTIDNCMPGSCDRDGRRAAQIPGEACRCQCANSHYVFREDLKECIKDVVECPVAMFVRPFAVERIPLVFLPLNGQLVYPGAHLIVSGIAKSNMSCSVKTSLLMTSEGWKPIRKENIFGIKHYDGNKTFLQWRGQDEDRRILQHHLVLIRLRCDFESNNGTFEPCAALRIGWAPGLGPEVPENSNKNHFIIIGLCLGILGLIYVLAVLIYLKVRKNRRDTRNGFESENSIEAPDEEGNSELRNAYINNLVQEAEFTSKSNLKGSAPSELDRAEASGSNDVKKSGEDVEDPVQSQDFFVRIRGMIAAAKNRLNSFRYRPTLLVIPEDDYYYQDYKERDMDKTKSLRKPPPKKASPATNNKVESIHGGKLGAAMLEAKLAPPLPPPRSAKLPPKNKKRAPSPPGEEGRRGSPMGGSLDRKKRKLATAVVHENYSKFDLFRLDLYEKINRLRDGGTTSSETGAVDISKKECKEKKDDIILGESPVLDRNNSKDSFCRTLEAPRHQEETKISRRELLYKLEEREAIEDSETTLKIKVKRREPPEMEFPRLQSTPSALTIGYNSRTDTEESLSSSTHTESSHKSECQQADILSDCSDASLSGDSLNSSFRKAKNPLRATENQSGSSVITSSTAIKEMEDADDEEIDDTTTQDDDSRLSTDLEGELYSLGDESEHPSLEEYLQLSTQVAKKLSERTVPSFSTDSPKEKNMISQFMKEFKTTIGRLKSAEEVKPMAARTDNWTLKSEEKRARVARKVSLFKRNPLKGRKNEEPLVTAEKNNCFDAVSEDDAGSSRSSSSSVSGNKKKYKPKTPEIVPAGAAKVVVDVAEKKIISITDGKSGEERNGKNVSKITFPRIQNKASGTPPLPPPKPQMKQGSSSDLNEDHSDSEHCNKHGNVIETDIDHSAKRERFILIRTPSIESDSISIANSDMTEDSLNQPLPNKDEDKSPEDISEDENGPIDQCLAQLADSVIQPPDDGSLNRYLNHLGNVLATRENYQLDQCLSKLASNMHGNRATKGFNLSNLPIFEHVCVDKGSDKDRSTPTSDRSSTTSRGSKSSQENLRKKTLTKSKHHHHHHHTVECKYNNGDNLHINNASEGNNHPKNVDSNRGNDGFTKHILMERMVQKGIIKGKSRIASTSEEEECGRASSLGSTRELETPIPETTSDPGSADLERPRKKRPMFRRSKKGLNGTCRQHIQNNKLNKKENSAPRKGGFKNCNSSTPRSSGSDVTVITLEGTKEILMTGDNANTFVTLINVDSSDCSNSAEEK